MIIIGKEPIKKPMIDAVETEIALVKIVTIVSLIAKVLLNDKCFWNCIKMDSLLYFSEE